MMHYFWTTDEAVWRKALVDLFKEKPDRKDIIAYRAVPVKPQVSVNIEVKL